MIIDTESEAPGERYFDRFQAICCAAEFEVTKLDSARLIAVDWQSGQPI